MTTSIVYASEYGINSTNNRITGSVGTGPFTITESTADREFVVGETVTITSSGGTQTGTYNGFFLFNGVANPIFTIGGSRFVFSNEAIATSTQVATTAEPIPICFGPDVLIATAQGAKRVKDLAVGDEVLTPSGPQAVKFIGWSARFLPDLRSMGRMPIQIEAGALGELGPDADLLCSPSHAFLIDGLLVEAQALVNGSSIRQLDSLESFEFTYYSIELENHALVWANGILAETYFANFRSQGLSRDAWDNHADYVALYGEGSSMRELELPRIPFARQLPAEVKERIGAQPLLAV